MRQGDYARHAPIWDLGGPDRTEEIVFYARLAEQYGRRVLSPMCATGTIASGLAELEFEVTGIDIEPAMIAAAAKRHPTAGTLILVVADILDLPFSKAAFDFVFIGSGDFHHFLTEKERLRALSGLRHVLRDGGCLVLDLIYPADDSWEAAQRRFDPPFPTGKGVKTWKLSGSRYHAGTRRLHIDQEVFIQQRNVAESFRHEFELQLLCREDLVILLERTGFDVIAEYGGFDGSPWQPAADKWLVTGMAVPGALRRTA